MKRRRPLAWTARSSCLLVLIAWVATAACGEPERGQTGIVVDTVGGIVTVSNAGAGLWEPGEGWTVSGPVLRIGSIGSIEEAGPTVFSRIGALAVGRDGSVFVADVDAREVRMFSPTGRFVTAFGGSGEGPGEFEHIDGLVVEPTGTIAVRDPRLGRVSRFAPDGTFETSFRLARPFMIFSDGTTFWGDREGRLYDRVNLATRVDQPEHIAVIRYSSAGNARDTFVLLAYESSRILATRGGQLVMAMSAPLASRPLVAVDKSGRIASGFSDGYRIAVRGPAGDTIHVFERTVKVQPISRAERDSIESAVRAQVEGLAPGARIAEANLPEHRPFASRLLADARGHWWVGPYRGEPSDEDLSAQFPTEYDIFDEEGRFLGTVETPPLLIMQIGDDFLAGVETDDLGVEYVAVYALIRT